MKKIERIIWERRVIHKYKEGDIPQHIMDKAIACAHQAPNRGLTLPMRLIQIPKDKRGVLSDLEIEWRESRKGALSKEKKDHIVRKYQVRSHLLIVVRSNHPSPEVEKEDFAHVAMAVQNFSLYLWGEKFGVKWSRGSILGSEKLYNILGLSIETCTIEGFLWAGTAKEIPPRSKKRVSKN